jgi:MFS family permease
MRPVRRLLVSHALAAVGMSLPWPLLLLLVWQRGDGDLAVGLTGAARMLPYVALSWATGTIADRFRRDRVVHGTLVARAALLLLVGGLVAHGWLLGAVLAASAAIACGTPAYPALAAAMPTVAGADRRRATDRLVTIEVASFVVGPAVGALLLRVGAWLPMVGVAMTLVALVLMRGVDLPCAASTVSGRLSPRSSARSVFGVAARCTGVPRAIGTVSLLNAVLAGLGLALLPLASDVWGGGYGIATAMLGFGALGAPLLGRLGRTATSRTRLGMVALAVPLGFVALSPVVHWALPLLASVGASAVHVESAATETIQGAVPDDRRAGILGLTDSSMVAAALAGSLIAPWLATTLGPRALVLLLAVACAAATVVPARAIEATVPPVPPPQRRRSRPDAGPSHEGRLGPPAGPCRLDATGQPGRQPGPARQQEGSRA